MSKLFTSLLLFLCVLSASCYQFDSDVCGTCEAVVTMGEMMLENNHTVSEIESVLIKSCGILPVQYQSDCATMVSMYLPEMIDLLENQYPPSVVCQDLHLCQNNLLKTAKHLPTINFCQVCTGFVSKVEKNLADLTTGSNWEHLAGQLDRMCQKLDRADERTVCETLIEAVPRLVSYEIGQYPPDRVCQMLRACEK